MARIIIVHGWEGSSRRNWMPWLKEQLQQKGHTVLVPDMPHANAPDIISWVAQIERIVGEPNEHTYFIGHSTGCQTIMRYLAQQDTLVGGCLYVAGWFNLKGGLDDEEDKQIAEPWLDISTIEFKNIHAKTQRAIFSKDDPFVPIGDAALFKEKLHTKNRIVDKVGHLDGKEYPVILEEAEAMLHG